MEEWQVITFSSTNSIRNGVNHWFLPVPNDIHSLDKFSEENIPTAMTTTSVSTVRIMTFPIQLWLAFAACSSISIFASSWFNRQRVDTLSNYLFIMADELIVLMINFSVSSFVTSFARKTKSSHLFSSRRKKIFRDLCSQKNPLLNAFTYEMKRKHLIFFYKNYCRNSLTLSVNIVTSCHAEDFKEFLT